MRRSRWTRSAALPPVPPAVPAVPPAVLRTGAGAAVGALLLLGLAPAASAEPPEDGERLLRAGPLLGDGAGGKPLDATTALSVRTPSELALSPDGKRLAFTLSVRGVQEGQSRSDLYWMPVDGSEPPRRLTTAEASSRAPVWSPDGQRLVFVRAVAGVPQLHVLSVAGGEAEVLTDLPGGASSPRWSPDGRRLAFLSEVHPECRDRECELEKRQEAKDSRSRARVYDELLHRHASAWTEPTVSHLFVLDTRRRRGPKDVTPGPDAVPPPHLSGGPAFDWVGADQLVYVVDRNARTALSTDHDLYLVPAKGGRARRLGGSEAWESGPVASPDGRHVAYLAHRRPGYESDRSELRVVEVASGQVAERSASLDRPIGEIAWSRDGSTLHLGLVDRGYRPIARVGREAGEVSIDVPRVSAGGLVAGPGGALYWVGSSLLEPPEIFAWSPAGRQVRRLSSLNDALLKSAQLGEVEERTVGTGTTAVHGFVVFPPGFDKRKRYPMLVLIHGGPQSAWTHAWSPRWNPQLFAAAGYVVALPNPRGSIGYGQAFTDAVRADWGGGPYDDVMAWTDELIRERWVRNKRVCAAGASYGGYMVHWINGHSRRFSCLIAHAGVWDLEAFYGDTDELWFPEWEFGGPPWAARETYRRWSPVLFADQMRTPTLILHGERDYRVDPSHSLAAFTALRRQGVRARLVVFPDEPHSVRGAANYVVWVEQMLGWLSEHLK